jgi:carboxypeptidase T
MPVFLVKIVATSYAEIVALDNYHLDLKERAAQQEDTNRFVVPGILTDEQIQDLKSAGYTVEIMKDLTQDAKERIGEVSRDNRFSDTTKVQGELRQRAISERYMNADEVESTLICLNKLFPDLITLIELPNKTIENRTSKAVLIHATQSQNRSDGGINNGDTSNTRTGILITGGVHAREWGGSDICINLVLDLISAYNNNTSMSYGAKQFSSEQIRNMLESIDLFVFPDVNPDGKIYSQSQDNPSFPQIQGMWWRKNRNPSPVLNGDDPVHSFGVDINRNFAFLWSSGIGTVNSNGTNRSQTYKGRRAFSEPETRNVRYLFDTYKNIQYYVDVHSFGELILYCWGNDNSQNVDPEQNFLNPEYDGWRGVPRRGGYKEYIPTDDENAMKTLANTMNRAINEVRGHNYSVQQAVGLYPTSGTSDDYAFSRHISNGSRSKIYSFTIEFGDLTFGFIPPISEMKEIVQEVSAALAELCTEISHHKR